MKPRHRILILVLLAGVFGGCAVPPVDAAETSFDESDAPVNLAPPSQATIRFVRAVSDPFVMPGLRFFERGDHPVANPNQQPGLQGSPCDYQFHAH
jgi:hypothetical protein